VLLERDAPFADKHLLLALAIGNRGALTKAFHCSLFTELAWVGPISREDMSWCAMPAAMVDRRFGSHQC
jgi:hypothetical protein